MIRVLPNKLAVQGALRNIFSVRQGRRIAVVAFVGEGAEAYLSNPRGVEIYCWPRAGGTNPNTLRALMRRGATIRFVDSLHMKLFWSRAGCVITSANLTTNALGSGNLQEIGVLLGADKVNIKHVIESLRSRPMGAADLRRLDRQHAELIATRSGFVCERPSANTFTDWFVAPHRPQWKVAMWHDYVYYTARSVREDLKSTYGRDDFIWTQGVGRGFRPNEWVLSVRTDKHDKVRSAPWMFVERVVRLRKGDRGFDPESPFEIVQVHPRRALGTPPFKIDGDFRDALRKVVAARDDVELCRSSTAFPNARLLRDLYAEMTNQSFEK